MSEEIQGPLKFFTPTPDDPRLKILAKKLKEEKFYLSDEFRDYDSIWKIIKYYFFENQNSIWYEIGNFGGLLGFVSIIPGWRGELFFKLWNKKEWKLSTAKAIKNEINNIVKIFDLKRLGLESGDPVSVKMGKMFKFEIEGRQGLGFSWNKRLGTKYLLRYLKKQKRRK